MTPKKPKADKPISQHEPTPDELDEAIKIENLKGESLLKELFRQKPETTGPQ